jgi:hypothetical protein
MKKILPFLLSFVALFLSFSLTGCKKDADLNRTTSFISVNNASLISLNFNIYEPGNEKDKEQVNDAVLQRGSSTGYVGVYDGTWILEAILTDSTSMKLTREQKLNGNEYISLFVIKPDSLDFFMIKDDLNERNADRPKIKFLNLSPDAGALSLEMTLLSANKSFPGINYKTFTPYQEIDEKSSYHISLKNSANAVLIEADQSFTRGKLYTIWTTGLIKPPLIAQRLQMHITEVK